MEERLRKFAQLVDAGSYTKASMELHISQPALSSAVSKLERELTAELLVHGSRSLKLTKAGKLAYDSAKELGIVSNNLKTRIADLLHDNPKLTIGMIDSVANVIFASKETVDTIDRVSKISIIVNNSRYLASAVDRDEVDVAYITDKPAHAYNKFIIEPVAKEPLVLVCNTKDLKKVNASLKKDEVQLFISYDQASATYRLIDEVMKKRKISYNPIYVSNSPAVALQLVLLQKGVAFLPYVLVKYYVDKNIVSVAGIDEPFVISRPINLIKRRGKLPLAAVSSISESLQNLMEAYDKDIISDRLF